MKTVYFKTLGCKVNQYETQGMRESLTRSGFCETDSPQDADFFILNSCTVTHQSDRKTLYYIRRFRKANPQGKVIITGCLVHHDPAALLERENIDFVIPNQEKPMIAHTLSNDKHHSLESHEFSISSFKGHVRAFVKVQDGCNMHCSYCKVRLVRGPSHSRSVPTITKEVEALIQSGYKEIVLTGVQLGAYGRDLTPAQDLIKLIDTITALPGIQRVRLSSLEPFDVSDELIHCIAENDKVCQHLHIPLQSGDDRILRTMRRTYTSASFLRLIDTVRKFMPGCGLTTDVIVGFPGEDETAFQHTLAVLEQFQPFKMHIFPFSPRQGTPAYYLTDKVSPKVIHQREDILQKLNARLFGVFAQKMRGKVYPVLIEREDTHTANRLMGRTEHYVAVTFTGTAALINAIVPVTIVGHATNRLNGVFTSEPELTKEETYASINLF